MARHHPRRDRSTSILSLVVVFVLLGGLSLAVGYFGGQYLLSGLRGPARETPSPEELEPDDEPTQTMSVAGESMPLYRVQAGAFGARVNAETRRDELHSMGYPAVVKQSADGMYRVIVTVTSSEAEADRLASALDSRGTESLAASWVVPSFSRQLTVSSEIGDGLQDLVTALGGLLFAEAALSDEGDISARAEAVAELWGQVKAGDGAVPDEFKILMEEYVAPHLDALQRGVESRESRETFIELLHALAEMGTDGG